MPESDCSTEFWEFVPYIIMLDYKSNTHDNVMYPAFPGASNEYRRKSDFPRKSTA